MDYYFRDGDRVRSVKYGTTGVVRTVPGDEECEPVTEVKWDGTFVANELDLVRDHIMHWD